MGSAWCSVMGGHSEHCPVFASQTEVSQGHSIGVPRTPHQRTKHGERIDLAQHDEEKWSKKNKGKLYQYRTIHLYDRIWVY